MEAPTGTGKPPVDKDLGSSADPHAELGTLHRAIAGVFRGPPANIDRLLTAFLAGGHVLLEDIPGVGKTTLGRALAQALGGTFRRLQCTPDLMPADITGISIYDERERAFVFHPGPIFCDVLLADELNRTPPRTQSALLEAMSEGQVTVDGTSHKLDPNFFCVATQNPIEHVGTYPLPESQRDRFLLSFGLGYPDRDDEVLILESDGAEDALAAIRPVIGTATAQNLRSRVRDVHVSAEVRAYVLDLVDHTRRSKALHLGASPRAALGLQRSGQAYALLKGRKFVAPEDVQEFAVSALAHRVAPRAGHDPRDVIAALVERVPVPR